LQGGDKNYLLNLFKAMRSILLIVCILLSSFLYAQNILIPYKSGTKYGICDEKGTLLVQPAYDEIEYLQDNYFQYTSKMVYKDTFRKVDGEIIVRDRDGYSSGVFYKTKLLISEQPYRYYIVFKNCIAGSANEYHPENCALYNLKGEKIIAGPVKGLGVNDTRDFGNMVTLSEKLTLLSVFERDENRNRIFSAAVYDNVQQKITGWLIRKARDFKVNKMYNGYAHVLCTYTDEKGYHEEYIRYVNNRFVVRPKAQLTPAEKAELERGSNYYPDEKGVSVVEVPTMSESEMPMLEAPRDPKEISLEEQERMGYIYYQRSNDTLYYVRPEGKSRVNIQPGTKLVFMISNATTQIPAVLYKQGNKFGIISKGSMSPADYDTMIYFADHFIAGKMMNGQLQFGILDKQGMETVPLIYDSIPGNMLQFRFDRTGLYPNQAMGMVLELKRVFYSPNTNPWVKYSNGPVLVYKNGKAGLIGMQHEILVPVQYDRLLENGMSYMEPARNDFILLEKDGLYGLAFINYDFKLKKYITSRTILPSFPGMPCYYLPDYYRVKGFSLYGLYAPDSRFMGFAGNNGKMYFR
jgi:hypothetical protein